MDLDWTFGYRFIWTLPTVLHRQTYVPPLPCLALFGSRRTFCAWTSAVAFGACRLVGFNKWFPAATTLRSADCSPWTFSRCRCHWTFSLRFLDWLQAFGSTVSVLVSYVCSVSCLVYRLFVCTVGFPVSPVYRCSGLVCWFALVSSYLGSLVSVCWVSRFDALRDSAFVARLDCAVATAHCLAASPAAARAASLLAPRRLLVCNAHNNNSVSGNGNMSAIMYNNNIKTNKR